ncbi:MAG: hypothetical protein A3K19_26925 [Lentisphaerae bacterium RIFOXYB12_FULL_65_16]|nr:MAG: hypothetical protein A3K18_23900 [Lentisphaerae bacterium RIFOXYA12_64_32]OGV88032.1 MAG: hypothetical protein A3K19_26925 [Lentisphaerae bacterium RIFOXYB12_FULL_65_16]
MDSHADKAGAAPKRQAVIYYLTGTGNSYRVASWMGDACRRHGVPARVIAIPHATPAEDLTPGDNQLLGLVTPTHGFTTPWLVLRFALGLPHGRGTRAFVTPTRAGAKFGPLFTPGMEGTAAYLLTLVLLLKGYNIRGVMGLDMPANWIVVHPGLSPVSAEAINARAATRVNFLMNRILAGERYLTGLLPLLLGLLILPVSVGYMLVGRFLLAKLFYASERCTGCGSCARACPAHAIRMWGANHPRPYWTFSCESCMRCMNFCPTQAVQASYPLAAALYFITTWPAGLILVNWLGRQWPPLARLGNPVTTVLVNYAYVLTATALTYLGFILLMRLPLVNRLFTAVTPTRYFRRYREPGTELKDIQ